MTKPTAPETLVLRRIYEVPPDRVFRAFTDAAERQQWDSPADGWVVEVLEMDLRVGGRYRAAFGPPGEVPYIEEDEYLEISPPRRLEFKETISRGGAVLQQTVCTVEFIDRGGRTEVVVTDHGIGAEVHRAGWTKALDHLAAFLIRLP